MFQININKRTWKIFDLLNKANNSKFVTRKWNIVNNNSNANYGVGNEIKCKTKLLKSL